MSASATKCPYRILTYPIVPADIGPAEIQPFWLLAVCRASDLDALTAGTLPFSRNISAAKEHFFLLQKLLEILN